MPQLDISTYALQLFWLVLSFSALYAMIRYIFVPSIESKMAARSALVEENILLAEQMLKEAEELKGKTDKLLQSARNEAKSIIAKSEQELKAFIEAKNKETEIACTALYNQGEKDANKFQQEIVQQIPEIVEIIKLEVIAKVLEVNKVRKI